MVTGVGAGAGSGAAAEAEAGAGTGRNRNRRRSSQAQSEQQQQQQQPIGVGVGVGAGVGGHRQHSRAITKATKQHFWPWHTAINLIYQSAWDKNDCQLPDVRQTCRPHPQFPIVVVCSSLLLCTEIEMPQKKVGGEVGCNNNKSITTNTKCSRRSEELTVIANSLRIAKQLARL